MTSAQTAWLIYDFANAAFALIVRTVFAPLCIKYCAEGAVAPEIATGYWGMTASISGIVAGVLSIFLGRLCDKKKCRKKIFAIFVFAGVLSTYGFAFCGKGDFNAAICMAFVSMGCYLCANSLYDSLLLDVSPRSNRDRLSVLGYALGYVGGVIPFIVCLILSFVLSDKISAMRWSFIIAGTWWLVLTLPLLFKVRERKRKDTVSLPFLQAAKEVWCNKNVRNFLISYFLYIDGVGTIYLMAAPIATDIGISQAALLGTILGLQFYAFPCTLLYGKLAKRFGSVRMILFAISTYTAASVLVGVMPSVGSAQVKLVIFVILAVIIGSSQGGIQSLSRSFYSRIIPPEQAAEYFGFYNLFGKFTTIVGPVLVFIMVKVSGFSEYGILLLTVPFILGGVMLSRVARKIG